MLVHIFILDARLSFDNNIDKYASLSGVGSIDRDAAKVLRDASVFCSCA